MPPAESRILIALDARGPSPSGHLEITGQAIRPFDGWLDLLAALGDAVERDLGGTPMATSPVRKHPPDGL